jgi:sporulation protein YlmC with PRC-barrel domain
MRKIMMFIMAMTVIAFTYMTTSVVAEGMMDPMGKTHEDTSLMVGKDVLNTEGDHLGIVKDFVKDSDGEVSFAVVSYGGFLGFGEKKVAVPYSALTYDKDKQHFTCAISKDRFANAPEFKDEEMLQDRSFAEEVYRYFGQQPYWTEESIGKSNSIDDSMGPGAWDFK